MRHASGATPDANGCAVDFDHLNRRKWTRVDILDIRNASPCWRCPYQAKKMEVSDITVKLFHIQKQFKRKKKSSLYP
jgi:hypothetical protein